MRDSASFSGAGQWSVPLAKVVPGEVPKHRECFHDTCLHFDKIRGRVSKETMSYFGTRKKYFKRSIINHEVN